MAQTGTALDYAPESSSTQDRHLSVRLTGNLAAVLDELARERRLSMSQIVRALLRDAVAQRASVAALDSDALAERLAADVAEVRKRLAG